MVPGESIGGEAIPSEIDQEKMFKFLREGLKLHFLHLHEPSQDNESHLRHHNMHLVEILRTFRVELDDLSFLDVLLVDLDAEVTGVCL